MIKQLLSLFLILITTTAFAQKKEKVKGSRVLTTEITPVYSFQRLVLNEDFEVKLVKADSTSVQIMTDDNLHEYITIVSQDSTLSLKTTARLQEKKLEITVFYNDILNTIELNEDAELSSENTIEFDELTLTTSESSRAYLTLDCNLFKIINNDRAKVELNLTANAVNLELNDNSRLTALINATNIVADLLESADAKIEGDVENLTLTSDNSSGFIGEKLSAKEATVTTENRAKASINVNGNLVINASGTSDISIFGSPTIILESFEDNAILRRK